MEVQSGSKISTPSSKLSSKRFLFDKRYGYVYDEWREPAEVALAYGRGMFCIAPLVKTLFTLASESVNLVASETIEVVKEPDRLKNHLHHVMFCIKNGHSETFGLKSGSPLHPITTSFPPHTETHD